MNRRVFSAVLVAAALSPPAVAEAVTVVRPADNAAVADPKPSFAWTLAPGEESQSFVLGDKKKLDASGNLSRGFINTGLGKAATSYRVRDGLYVGTYYWQVSAYNPTLGQMAYSAITRIKIAPEITVGRVRTYDARILHGPGPTNPHATGFKTKITCNFGNPMTLTLKVTRGAGKHPKLVKSTDYQVICNGPGKGSPVDITYPGGDVAPRTKLNATLVFHGGGAKTSATATFKSY
jgi:hypothetical protein